MNFISPDDLTTIRKIILQELASLQVNVYLFGSRATRTATARSDVDVAIEPLGPLPKGLLSTIREKLEDSNILCEVDLIDLSQASATFKKNVICQGEKWKIC